MSKTAGIKTAAIVLLLAAAFFGPALLRPGLPPGTARGMPLWMTCIMLGFGIVNVLMAVPGTQGLRIIAIACSIGTLLFPRYLGLAMTLLVFLVWPVWILIAWSATADHAAGDVESHPAIGARASTAGLVIAVAVAAIIYQLLVHHRLEQTAALFVGIPTILAIVVVFWASPRSAAGVACRAVTIGLLMSMMFLWEGALCVAMSAPLFYGIAVLVGSVVDAARRRRAAQSTLSCLLIVVLVPMSFEGVTDKTSFNRDERVAVTRLIRATTADVDRAMLAAPRFYRPLPLYLRAGFPRATHLRIEETAAGTRWIIAIRGGEMKLNGMEARTGMLVLHVEEARAGFMRWRVVSDDSHMTHFLRWREAQVEWEPATAGATKVTWTLRYDRALDPAWYFGPWERYAARLAAGYLIDSVATP